jgi:hypothetical protein
MMRADFAEATINTVLGLLIGWAILRAYGMSGATALAALDEGFRPVLIEMAKHVAIIRERLASAWGLFS